MDIFVVLCELFIEVIGLFEAEIGFALGTDAGVDTATMFGVGGRLDDADFVSALFVIKRHLEELHSFTAAHRAVTEV